MCIYIYTVVLYGYIIVRLSTTLCCCCPPFSHLILTYGSCQCPQVCVSLFGYLHVHMCTQYKRTYLRAIFWVYGPSLQDWNSYCAFSLGFPIYVCCFLFEQWPTPLADTVVWKDSFRGWESLGTNQYTSELHLRPCFLLAPFPGWWIPISVKCIIIPFLKVTWIASSSLITPDFSLLNPNLWCLMLKSPILILLMTYKFLSRHFRGPVRPFRWGLGVSLSPSRWFCSGRLQERWGMMRVW